MRQSSMSDERAARHDHGRGFGETSSQDFSNLIVGLSPRSARSRRGIHPLSLAKAAARLEVSRLYRVLGSVQRKQRGFGRRLVGNGVEFGIMLAQRLRDLHFFVLQDADELERIDDGLALKMVVGDDERQLCMLADFANARDPRL